MLPNYILKRIEEGEGLTLDFKHSIADNIKIAKSLVAFANASGGTLLVGVDDKKRIVGIDEDEESYMLHLTAQNFCKPSIPIEVKEHTTQNGKTILECNVAALKNKPFMAKELTGKYLAYIRVEDECVLASPVMFLKMKLENTGTVNQVFAKDEQLVLQILKEHGALVINKICKLSYLEYAVVLNILAKLAYLSIVAEQKLNNKYNYFVV